MLHTRAPTGKSFGPTLTLLESNPITFQVIGVTVKEVAAETEDGGKISDTTTTIAARVESATFCQEKEPERGE